MFNPTVSLFQFHLFFCTTFWQIINIIIIISSSLSSLSSPSSINIIITNIVNIIILDITVIPRHHYHLRLFFCKTFLAGFQLAFGLFQSLTSLPQFVTLFAIYEDLRMRANEDLTMWNRQCGSDNVDQTMLI